MRNSSATRRPKRARRSSNERPQEAGCLGGVVDIARPVLQPEDVASLGEVGQSCFLLEAFVSRVNRRHAIRTVRFWGST